MRANAAHRESEFRLRTTDQLYDWQSKSLSNTFILHDGPPYANGSLHIGHALNKIIKDFINRFQILRGRRVEYVPGWDCHGLPIELKALKDTKKISALTPVVIREKARQLALDTIALQKQQFREWAIIGDWDHPYRTLDFEYEANQLKIFSTMFSSGLIYRKLKPVYWSPSSQTALAEAELDYVDNYSSRSIYVKFAISLPNISDKCFALIWTTTPWTLPANRAIAVNPNMTYLVVDSMETNESYLIAKSQSSKLQDLFPSINLSIRCEMVGKDLENVTYQHPITSDVYKIICGDFVTDDAGTGLVHTAPGHGFDDYLACVKHQIEPFCPVDSYGKYDENAGSRLQGLNVLKEGSSEIISIMAEKNLLLREENHLHRYPHDWRTKKPVIIRATKQWFADVSKIKNDACTALESVYFFPETGLSRLKSCINNRSEWCISRQRSWGVPIPVFYHKESGEELINDDIISHVVNLVRDNGSSCWWEKSVSELLPIDLNDKANFFQIGTDTMDVWFDSGVSWNIFCGKVADIYLEGTDQHRGWFQSSLLTSIATNDRSPFKTLITHGFVNDEKGRKMSKSVGNVIDPSYITKDGKSKDGKRNLGYGVDVMRYWVCSTDYTKDVSVGDNILKQTAESLRKMRNVIRFLLGNLHDFDPQKHLVTYECLKPLDRYMLSGLFDMSQSFEKDMNDYEFRKVYTSLNKFTSTDLSSFYFDIIKDSLYNDAVNDERRRSSQTALFKILEHLMVMIAPITPHLSEEIFDQYQKICSKRELFSVFQLGWQEAETVWNDAPLKSDFNTLKNIRNSVNIKLEHLRQKGKIGSPLEAVVELVAGNHEYNILEKYKNELAQFFITADVKLQNAISKNSLDIHVSPSPFKKCCRCRSFVAMEENGLCKRCEPIVKSAI